MHPPVPHVTFGLSEDGALLRARLTDPHGWLLSNTITSDTIAAMEEVRAICFSLSTFVELF